MNERKKEIIVSVYATLLISFKLHGKHFNVLLKTELFADWKIY